MVLLALISLGAAEHQNREVTPSKQAIYIVCCTKHRTQTEKITPLGDVRGVFEEGLICYFE